MSNRDQYTQPGNSYATDFKTFKLNKEHETTQLKEEHDYNLKSQKQELDHEKDILKCKLGFVGKTFGNTEHASKNITAAICILLTLGVSIISCIVYFSTQDLIFIEKMWEGLFPIITLSLGYLFGKNN